MLHHLLSTGLSDTSWLGLILSQHEHHIPHCQRKFHFSPSLMGDYCNVKPWDLNNTSRFYYEEKGLYFGVFLLQRSPDTKPWITWNNRLQWSAREDFLRKKTALLDKRGELHDPIIPRKEFQVFRGLALLQGPLILSLPWAFLFPRNWFPPTLNLSPGPLQPHGEASPQHAEKGSD